MLDLNLSLRLLEDLSVSQTVIEVSVTVIEKEDEGLNGLDDGIY